MPSREARAARAQQLRQRAGGLRVIADLMTNRNSKETLIRIAVDYESLASRAETMSDASDYRFGRKLN